MLRKEAKKRKKDAVVYGIEDRQLINQRRKRAINQ